MDETLAQGRTHPAVRTVVLIALRSERGTGATSQSGPGFHVVGVRDAAGRRGMSVRGSLGELERVVGARVAVQQRVGREGLADAGRSAGPRHDVRGSHIGPCTSTLARRRAR